MTPPYRFRPTDDGDAREISAWRYDPPYDFYDANADTADLAELMDPESKKDAYFSVLDGDDRIAGFFQFGVKGETVDVGLGLRPDLAGKGRGLGFLLSGATFNRRAIAVCGRGGVFMHETTGGQHEFLRMEREA